MSSTVGDLPPNVSRVLTTLVDAAAAALGDTLRAIVLFGTAAENRLRSTSDVNVLILVTRFDASSVDALRPAPGAGTCGGTAGVDVAHRASPARELCARARTRRASRGADRRCGRTAPRERRRDPGTAAEPGGERPGSIGKPRPQLVGSGRAQRHRRHQPGAGNAPARARRRADVVPQGHRSRERLAPAAPRRCPEAA